MTLPNYAQQTLLERRYRLIISGFVSPLPLDWVAVDFVADNPGDTLLHCHQPLHMDFGFMQLMKYVG